jgi:ABC-2 type transport system permease protein
MDCKTIRAVSQDLWKGRAFLIRNLCFLRRDFSWFLALLVHTVVSNVAVVLIGVSCHDQLLTLNLTIGVLLWAFLSSLFSEVAYSISQERLDGVIEETFAAPVSRTAHLLGVAIFAWLKALLEVVLIAASILIFVRVDLTGANLGGAVLIVLLASLSFVGLGLMVAILPLLNAERGYQANYIVQGLILLVSGVFYPVTVLPVWMQKLAVLSPATYAMDALRKLIGVSVTGSRPGALLGQTLWSVSPELAPMLALGILSIPLGLWAFSIAEHWAKRVGKLKRSG